MHDVGGAGTCIESVGRLTQRSAHRLLNSSCPHSFSDQHCFSTAQNLQVRAVDLFMANQWSFTLLECDVRGLAITDNGAIATCGWLCAFTVPGIG